MQAASHALVLPELSVVAADVLIGSDFVASSGGLHLEYSDDGSLVGVTFGRAAMIDVEADVAASTVESALPGSECDVEQKLSRHIAVEHDGDDVVFSVYDGEVRWCGSEGHWVARWRWADGNAPVGNIGPGVAEYSRSRLSAEQEEKFSAAVDECQLVENCWLVDHDTDKRGSLAQWSRWIQKIHTNMHMANVLSVRDWVIWPLWTCSTVFSWTVLFFSFCGLCNCRKYITNTNIIIIFW